MIDQDKVKKGKPVPMDAKVKCTEAFDNHTEEFLLEDFLEFCN